ncbi:penicillin-binding protein 1B [Thalassotalea maritima]|uniref:penicillin-binding protein 1B n=1 Tax=Thalassotalea maritima TaxID=3242416 RepID=UPI0035293D02
MSKKKQPGFTKGKVAPEKKQDFAHWFVATGLKLSLIFVAAFLVYGIYLDGKVRQKFEGQRWQLPAQVYGKVLRFSKNSDIKLELLVQQLDYMGYQRVEFIRLPGQYAVADNGIQIYRRAFDFGYGLEQPTKLDIKIRNDAIAKLLRDNRPAAQLLIEPVLLDRITSADGEDRQVLGLQQVPQQLIDTLLLVEDRDFYHHHGISPTGILRAFWQNLLAGRTVQGGSTLTQQLTKNMYLNRDKTLWRKVNEAMMSVILEIRYSKDQLLEAYINEVYLGQHFANGIHGFGLAAKFYFGKDIQQLHSHEVALLVALVKGPSLYDPWRSPESARHRRDLVLKLMFENHFFNSDEYQQLVSLPLGVRPERRMAKQTFPAYMQLVRRELKQMGATSALQSGIRIFTGFDINKQLFAEKALINQLQALQANMPSQGLQGAVVVSDIRSGAVEAVVGGKEVKFSGFNRALDAQRPIGSLIKPVVYLTALQKPAQFSFATLLEDKPLSLISSKEHVWQPKNYDGKYRGSVSLLEALIASLNVPTVNLGQQLGVSSVADTLWSLGYQQTIEQVPSLFLGAINMSPLQVNNWYNTIANGGMYNQSSAINYVLSGNGDELWSRFQSVDLRIDENVSYLLDYALTQVAQRGTAQALTWRLPDTVVAGKTGTSNDGRDAWFVGYDQQTMVTTWVGFDDNKSTTLTGSSAALPIFANIINQYGGVSRSDIMPSGVSMTRFELATGNAVQGNCKDVASYPAIVEAITYSSSCLQEKEQSLTWLKQLFGLDSD